jgi:hypothetical protein
MPHISNVRRLSEHQMTQSDTYRFVVERSEYEAADKSARVAYAPALVLPDAVAPMATELERIAASVEAVNVLRPIHAFKLLKTARFELSVVQPRYQACLADCHKRLGEPVEGAPVMDNSWFQGISTAMGISALSRLTEANRSAAEVVDRKSAYALASTSMYVALVSLAATVVFGWLSLK